MAHRYPEPSYNCDSCDHPKDQQLCYCGSCDDFTDGYVADTDEYTDEDLLADFADFLYDTRRDEDLLGELGQ